MLDFDNEETYFLILNVCKEFCVDPSSSFESEDYFRNLLSKYNGEDSEKNISEWLKQTLSNEFVAIQTRPQWIQGPAWPVINGHPMMFVGQWDLNVSECHGLFHDDTSIYVFVAPNSEPKVVVQQY